MKLGEELLKDKFSPARDKEENLSNREQPVPGIHRLESCLGLRPVLSHARETFLWVILVLQFKKYHVVCSSSRLLTRIGLGPVRLRPVVADNYRDNFIDLSSFENHLYVCKLLLLRTRIRPKEMLLAHFPVRVETKPLYIKVILQATRS